MAQNNKNYEKELEDLKEELEHYQQEKERVRAIIGKIGGVPTRSRAKLINIIFISLIAVFLVISLIAGEKWRLLMIEFATIALSLKIIYLIYSQMKINHFEFWMLSSIEFRLNEMMKLVRQIKNQDL